MLNRIIATVVCILLHVVFYVIFKNFLSGTAFVMTVYACTLITFVIIDGFLLKLRHKKRGVKHDEINK